MVSYDYVCDGMASKRRCQNRVLEKSLSLVLARFLEDNRGRRLTNTAIVVTATAFFGGVNVRGVGGVGGLVSLGSLGSLSPLTD